MKKKTSTVINDETRRTYTTPEKLTQAGYRVACKAALQLALAYGPGWEHWAGDSVYVVEDDGSIVRIIHGPDGQSFRTLILDHHDNLAAMEGLAAAE